MSLQTNVTNLATRVATEAKALRTLINGNAADLSALQTTAKNNLVAAINEIKAGQSGAAGINDEVTGTSSTWSSSKIDGEIDAAVAALVGSAPATLDTIQEIATALGSADAVTTLTTAVGNRVRYDAVQSLTAPQQAQARSNIGAAATSDVTTLRTDMGDHNADFVATFEAGLA